MTKRQIIPCIMAILLGGSIFYWFQIRPSKIRQRCIQEAHDKTDIMTQSAMKLEIINTQDDTNNYISKFYNNCLIYSGMKPEKLIVQ